MIDKSFIVSVIILTLLATLAVVFIALYFTKPFTNYVVGPQVTTFTREMFNFDDGQAFSCTSLTQWGDFSGGTYFGLIDSLPYSSILIRPPNFSEQLYSVTNIMTLVFDSAFMEYTSNFNQGSTFVNHSPSFTSAPTFSLNFSYTNNTTDILWLCYSPP